MALPRTNNIKTHFKYTFLLFENSELKATAGTKQHL